MKPIHADKFQHDGRGPELVEVFWSNRGTTLAGVTYHNPDDDYSTDPIRHARFVKAQVVMITPEEVIGPGQLLDSIGRFRPAAMFDLGRTDWLASFDPRHLDRCSHYQLLFYDDLFDVICEAIECGSGPLPG